MQRRGPNLTQRQQLTRPSTSTVSPRSHPPYPTEDESIPMSSRNVGERIWIQVEIIWETVMDTFGSYGESVRRPLIIFASLALVMTLRSARRGVRKTTRPGAYGSPYGTVPRGGPATMQYKRPPVGGGVGGTPPAYGGAVPSAYGSRNTLQQVGGAPAQPYGQPPQPAGQGIADLVDMHGAALHVLQPGLLKDFGGVTDFQGQIETVHGFESAAIVEQVLAQPGQNKVLVVDGGGDLRASIFDANMAMTAQRNGWKGVILNGAVRNAGRLATVPIGVKALGTNPIRGQAAKGQQGAALTFAGVQINPGFWIYADRDGVVISEREISGAQLSGGGSALPALGGGTALYGNTAGQPYQSSAGLRGTAANAAAAPYGAAAPRPGQPVGGAYGAANVAPAYGAAANAAPAYGAAATAYRPPGQAQAGRAPTYPTAASRTASRPAPSYQYRNRESANKKFLGKFVGMCFLFTSFMLMVKSVTG